MRHERLPIEGTKWGIFARSITPTGRPQPHPHRLWNRIPIICEVRSGIVQQADGGLLRQLL